MIEMDLFYSRNVSFGLDLWVMLMTPAALVAQMLELVQPRVVKLANQKTGPQPSMSTVKTATAPFERVLVCSSQPISGALTPRRRRH
jgi:hypothetical protein